MRALVYFGVGDIRVSELPAPDIRPTDVVLRVEACGICGSDMSSYLRGQFVKPGQVLGHEISARVTQIGADIRGLSTGQRVTVRATRWCRECYLCSSGRPYLCEESHARSIGYGVQGGFADFVVVPNAVVGSDVVPVPDHLAPEEVLWVEPLAVAVHALGRACLMDTDPLLVIGAGSVGLCIASVAWAMGIRDITMVEPRADRRTAATTIGGRVLARPDVGSSSFAAAIETSGRHDAVAAAAAQLRPWGRLVLVGLGDAQVPWPLRVNALTSFAYSDDDFRQAVDHLASGRVSMARFLTHRYSLARGGEAFAAGMDDSSTIKAAIFP